MDKLATGDQLLKMLCSSLSKPEYYYYELSATELGSKIPNFCIACRGLFTSDHSRVV